MPAVPEGMRRPRPHRVVVLGILALIAVPMAVNAATLVPASPASSSAGSCGQPVESWGAAEADGIAIALEGFDADFAPGTPAGAESLAVATVTVTVKRDAPAHFDPADFVLTTCTGERISASKLELSLQDPRSAGPAASGTVRFGLDRDETPLSLTIITHSPDRSPGAVTFPLRSCGGGAAGASARGGDGIAGGNSDAPDRTPTPSATTTTTPLECPSDPTETPAR